MIAVAGAIILLLIVGSAADLRRPHVAMLNDQVGYISVARNLLETGTLSSNIIYTSTLNQKATKNYLYMPGHYLALALSFAVGGVGPMQAVVPSLLCYVLSCVCVYLTGLRLYSRAAGFLAAALFAILPANLLYAFTGMSELTLVAAVCVAFCLFVWLPPLLRPCLGPLLLVLPFCFRETGALVVIPMAGLVLGGVPLLQRIPWDRWRATGIFCLLSVMLLALVFQSPVSSGRPSLIKPMVFDTNDFEYYHDATIVDRLPTGAGAWAGAIRAKLARNVQRLRELAHTQPFGLELAAVGAVWAVTLLALAYGGRRRDAMAFGCGLMGLAITLLLFALYATSQYRGLRMLMFAWPLLAVVMGDAMARLLPGDDVNRKRLPNVLMTGLIAAIGVSSALLARQGVHMLSSNDEADATTLALVESIGHDTRRLLASPYWVGLEHAAVHHPMKWAFLPANAQSLALLTREHDVGTLLIPDGATFLTEQDLIDAGFVFDGAVVARQQRIGIYRNHRARRS